MKYRVVISDEALAGAREYLRYVAEREQSLEVAKRWWRKALQKVDALESFPSRCPRAPEDEWRQQDLRALVVDRCVFVYHVDEETQVVRVLRFRHGSQEPRG